MQSVQVQQHVAIKADRNKWWPCWALGFPQEDFSQSRPACAPPPIGLTRRRLCPPMDVRIGFQCDVLTMNDDGFKVA